MDTGATRERYQDVLVPLRGIACRLRRRRIRNKGRFTTWNECKGLSESRAEDYYANGQVVGRKMFGIKNSILPDREQGPSNGGTYYDLTDALGSVTDLVETKGTVDRQYRYDAFGGLFTGTMGLYNTTGLTGKSYDAKIGMMDYSARWYDPAVGRFTQADSYLGQLDVPLSEHRYSYAHNNPVNLTDPTGHYAADEDTSATDDPYITYNGTWVRTDFGGGEVPTQPDGDAWTRIWVTKTKWTRHWWKYTKDDNTFVSEGDEPWDGEYRVEIDFVLKNGVRDQTEDIPRITGSLRPEGAEDPDSGPTKEQLEQQAREQAERIINETVGTAPVMVSTGVPDATAGSTYSPLSLGQQNLLNDVKSGDSMSINVSQVQCRSGVSTVAYCSQLYNALVDQGVKMESKDTFMLLVNSGNALGGFERETYGAYNPEAAVTGLSTFGTGNFGPATSSVATVGNPSPPTNQTSPDTVRVGRWMSPAEYEAMVKSGRVQQGAGGSTRVASPATPNAYKAAPIGDIYVEFDVPAGVSKPAGTEGWRQIPGPGSIQDRFLIKQGLPGITEMPQATNISGPIMPQE